MTDDEPTETLADIQPTEPLADLLPPAAGLAPGVMAANTAETTEVAADAQVPATGAASEASAGPRPRTRWAGIVWGIALAALASAGIWLASGAGRLDDLSTWVGDLSPAAAVGYGVLAVGALLLITGLVGLLRRAQRALSDRASSFVG